MKTNSRRARLASKFALSIIANLIMTLGLVGVSSPVRGQDIKDIRVSYSPPEGTSPAVLKWVSKPMAFYGVQKSTDGVNWSLLGFATGPSMSVSDMVKKPWSSVCTSFDGVKLVAATNRGYIHISSDSGKTWTECTSAGSRDWSCVISADVGSKIFATVYGGYIYASTDSGNTWVQKTSDAVRAWILIASSADGSKLYAVERYGYIYASADSGNSWVRCDSAGSQNWSSIDCDASGSKLGATVNGGSIWVSSNSGAVWNRIPNPLDGIVNGTDYSHSYAWSSIEVSADGQKYTAFNGLGGPMRKSSDGGVTWFDNSWTDSGFYSLSMDSAGVNLVAIGDQGSRLLISENSGMTGYFSSDRTFTWRSVSLSGDGKRIIAIDSNGYLYTGTVGEQSFRVYEQDKGSPNCIYRIYKNG